MGTGFRRTGLRADTNRVHLEANGGIPPLFWESVDKITAQIVALLSPLYTALGEEAPSRSSYQALHDIVALAGWLNVAIRLSPKITIFEWVQPGEAYRHSYVCIGEEKIATTSTPASSRRSQNLRNRTRVMISTAPKITRFARGSDGLFTGTATYEVMQPHVVTYTGLYTDWEDNRVVPLQRHVRSRAFQFPIRVLSLLMRMIRLAAVLCLAGFFGLMVFGAWTSVHGGQGDFRAGVVQMALLPIRLSFRCIMWWFGFIARHSKARAEYGVVNTKWSWIKY